jgi:hypothetical protein
VEDLALDAKQHQLLLMVPNLDMVEDTGRMDLIQMLAKPRFLL